MGEALRALGRWHDASSRALFAAAGGALLLAVGLYGFEVAARYAFDAPTTWSGEAVQYALAVMIFGALPDVTRRAAHVAIDILPEALSSGPRAALGRINNIVAAAATGFAGWIVAGQAFKQFERGLMTNAAHPIPRCTLYTSDPADE